MSRGCLALQGIPAPFEGAEAVYHGDTEVLFPVRLIPHLRQLRGPVWQRLVQRVQQSPPSSPEVLGFVLMMARLANCAGCSMDTFRAMRGCALCARRTVERFRGSDEELVSLWEAAVEEVRAFLKAHDLADPAAA